MTGRDERRRWRPLLRRVWAVIALTVSAGCAATAPIPIPAELPLHTNDQIFTIDWALQREPTVVRAVGRVSYTFSTEVQLTLMLFGLDANGRIVSRRNGFFRSDFGRGPIPFVLELTPTGREASFELRVLHYVLPGLRTN